MNNCMDHKKTWMISLGSVVGVAAVGLGAAAIWNSRQMRLMRTAKRTGKLLYKMGTVLQTLSGVAEEF